LGAKIRLIPLAALVVIGAGVACAQSPADWLSGVDLSRQNTRVRPGDEFFRYTLGSWYAKAPMPPGQPEAAAATLRKDLDASACEILRNMDAWEGALGVRMLSFYSLKANALHSELPIREAASHFISD
jgi:predicted metalloendopeptidase